MADNKLNPFEKLKSAAVSGMQGIDVKTLKEKAADAGAFLGEKAGSIKEAAMSTKEEIEQKVTELDRMLQSSIIEYNDAFTLMNDKGVRLYVERTQSVDTISFVENLVNSIANRPKTFDADFQEIDTCREKFTDSCEFAERELQAARSAAGGAGAGLAGGAAVAMMAPTAAMWVATTFGTASTGTAISALSGAAASNAALAWLGGGALTAGGGGMAAGNALLAMAGPIGWTIAGATLLTSIMLFANNKMKLNKEKSSEIEAVKKNTETVRELDGKIESLLSETCKIRSELNELYKKSLRFYGGDYSSFTSEDKQVLGALVNNTKALSAMFEKTIS